MEDILKIIEEKGSVVIYSLLGLVVLLLGIILLQFIQNDTKEMAPEMDVYEELIAEELAFDNQEEETQEALEDIPIAPKDIVVDVKGAVHAPGVYKMDANSRIVDAIDKAGGFISDAEQDAVNLAQLVEDQMVIYIPEVGEQEIDMVHLNPTSPNTDGGADDSTSQIDINQAEKEGLMTLSGIGSSKAESIISYREENGFFQTIEDIKNVSGIGDATFEKIKDSIRVGP